MRQCAEVCGSVRQCAAVCGSVRQCGSAAVYGSAAVCSSIAVRGSARGCVRQCAWGRVWCTTVCESALYVYITQSRSQYILVCPYRGDRNEPYIPCIFLIFPKLLTDELTDLYELLIRINMN
jgi:hypothetical protein